jgi:hypothetical protein
VRRLLRALTRRLAAALITAVAALLALLVLLVLLMPGVSYAAGQSTAAAQARSSPGLALDGCTGVTPAAFPAVGFITDPDRSQAGHLWWRPEADGVCIGTVVEFVQYNTTATKTWWVIVYSAGYPQGQVVGARTFSLGPGWYYFGFGVHQVFSGLSRVCITAGDSFGVSCIEIGQSQLRRFCVVGVVAARSVRCRGRFATPRPVRCRGRFATPRPVRDPRPVRCRGRFAAAAGSGAPTVHGAGGVRDDHRERRDHQRHGRDDDRRGHRVPVQHRPGEDKQPNADRHEHEVQTLVPARWLRSRRVRSRRLRPRRSVPVSSVVRCQLQSPPGSTYALGGSRLLACRNTDGARPRRASSESFRM